MKWSRSTGPRQHCCGRPSSSASSYVSLVHFVFAVRPLSLVDRLSSSVSNLEKRLEVLKKQNHLKRATKRRVIEARSSPLALEVWPFCFQELQEYESRCCWWNSTTKLLAQPPRISISCLRLISGRNIVPPPGTRTAT